MRSNSSNGLTVARLRELLKYEAKTGCFTWRVRPSSNMDAGDVAGCMVKLTGYWQIRLLGRTYRAHRLAWYYVHGEWPAKEIDHVNRIRSDNRISNLRLATHSENKQNTSLRKTNTSGHKGVSWHKRDQRWAAEIKINGKKHYLGSFSDLNNAIAARKSGEAMLHPFAAV